MAACALHIYLRTKNPVNYCNEYLTDNSAETVMNCSDIFTPLERGRNRRCNAEAKVVRDRFVRYFNME
jgi:hypothetical protein